MKQTDNHNMININIPTAPDMKDTGVTFPLSEIQRAYYMGRNTGFELGGTSTQVTYAFETDLEMDRLERALNRVIQMQPMLRTVVLDENRQLTLPEVSYYKLKCRNLAGLSEEDFRNTFRNICDKAFEQVFRADRWPLFEWIYIRGPLKNYLVITYDLLIADGASLMTISRQLMVYYRNEEAAALQLYKTYENYITEKLKKKNEKRYIKSRNYWADRIDQIPPAPALPYKRSRNRNVISGTVKRTVALVESSLWSRLKEMSDTHQVSPSMTVLAAYATVLNYWSAEKAFTVNMTITERRKYHMEDVVGDYTSSMLIPVEKDIFGFQSFWDTAAYLAKVFSASYRHSSFEGVEVIKELAGKHGMEAMAVMPVVFTSLLIGRREYEEIYNLGRLVWGISRTPQVILDCQVEESHGSLIITWDYAGEYMDDGLAVRMQSQMKRILESAASGCSSRKISESVFTVTEGERRAWQKYNDTGTGLQKDTLTDLFEKSAGKYPDNTAVQDDEGSMTYSELDSRSAAAAARLRDKGIGRGDFVAVMAERKKETIVNILAVLRSGSAYVPVPEDAGRERRRYIMEHSGCRAVLRGSEIEFRDAAVGTKRDGTYNAEDPAAYVIYTSGTTGRPKGVVTGGRAAANTVIDINQKMHISEDDVFIGLSSMGFDLSVYDIFGALAAGARLVMVSDNRNPRYLEELLDKEKVTVWNSVPSMLEMLFAYVNKDKIFSSMKVVMMSGDWIPLTLPEKCRHHFPDARLYSLGGATEASIWSIMYPIGELENGWKSIPYGYPMRNQNIYVLDRSGRLCPEGVAGEICIGGSGLAEGYLNDPEKTANAFVDHSIYGRIYRTGDIGYMSREGYVNILGRLDNQVKINGFRIETEEIVSRLTDIEGVDDAVVLPMFNNSQIYAFVKGNPDMDETAMQLAIADYLPSYMIPKKIISMDQFPLTSNGKISYPGLRKIAADHAGRVNDRPSTDLEIMLADLWKKILDVDEVGIDQSFFELGGDSISAAQVFAEVESAGYEINIADLYKNNTIRRLARVLRRKEDKAAGPADVEMDTGEI